jgi:hypothetical protein
MPDTKVITASPVKQFANTYVGTQGTVFYDPIVPELRLSDGHTLGGIIIAGGGGIGPQGPQGNQGNQGNQGTTGPQGNQGNQGNQGATGLQGPQGNQGNQGNQGATGPQGNQGNQGNQGPQGNQGNQGIAGISASQWDYHTDGTTVPPASGYISWNNSSQISSTNIYINDMTFDNYDITAFLATLAAGYDFQIQDANNSANFQSWKITGSTIPNTGYYDIPVSLLSSGGTGTTNFPTNHAVVLIINRIGPQGPQGNQGVAGIAAILVDPFVSTDAGPFVFGHALGHTPLAVTFTMTNANSLGQFWLDTSNVSAGFDSANVYGIASDIDVSGQIVIFG